jgi:hypothetical protein
LEKGFTLKGIKADLNPSLISLYEMERLAILLSAAKILKSISVK